MTTNFWLAGWCAAASLSQEPLPLEGGNLLRLHTVADGFIVVACFSISCVLYHFARKRRDLPYPGLFLLFAGLVAACGADHFMAVVALWRQVPWLSLPVKLAAAGFALAGAGALIRTVPRALALPGADELRQQKTALETRVHDRTADLIAVNEELRREVALRRQAEAEVHRLNSSVQRRLNDMKTMFELLPVGVGIAHDADCHDISMNPALARMLAPPSGVNAPSEPVSRNFRVFAGDRLLGSEELPMQVAVRENRPVVNMEEIIERADGTRIVVLANAVPLQDEAGRCHGCVATFQDITRHKDMEDELRLIVEAAPNAMIKTDGRGCITLVNSQAEALFGYGRAELLGQPVEVLVPERLRSAHAGFCAEFFSAPNARTIGGRELTGRRKDGSEIPIEIGLNPIRTTHGLVVLAAIIDITKRKQADHHRRELDRKLQETQKLESLGVLAGGIAHDFNNLLTGILGNACLARMDLPRTSTILPVIEQIEQATHRAADLCRQMLAYSGRGRFVVQRLDLNQLVEDTTHLLNISISKNCVIRFNFATALPAVSADATQLRQIIMNLVINASEAIGARSGVIALSTGVVRVDQDYVATLLYPDGVTCGDYVFLEVSDNGAGMDATTLAKIFDPFFTTKFTGRGLGLAAVLGIIRGHKGAMKVYSEQGRGTTFKILLPCADGVAEAATPPRPADGRWSGRGTVLVVDDEETVRSVSARLLEALGFSTVLAADGREAVEIYRREPARYALVLLDLTMPHMDGEETFRQLRHLNPGVKVVLMSGFNQQEAISRFTGKGLAGFVQKPFEMGSISAAVREVFFQT